MAERLAEGRTKVARQLDRLDPFTFWTIPRDGVAEFVVVGTTGAFLIAVVSTPGTVDLQKGRLAVDGVALDGHRRLKSEAKRLQLTFSQATVPVQVEPVICLTHAVAGAPRIDRGVRVVHVRDLAKDIADRPRVLLRLRAQRAARVLGMKLAGDERRIFIGGR
ncbi:MAG: hypothetical protein QOE25_1468 [Actinomycetota bacterium]|nr:hypothetical protein [Actinomycetota bacterium]